MHVNTVHARCSFVIKTEGGGDVAASNFRNLTNPGLPEISWDFARPSNWIRSGNEGRKRDRGNEKEGNTPIRFDTDPFQGGRLERHNSPHKAQCTIYFCDARNVPIRQKIYAVGSASSHPQRSEPRTRGPSDISNLEAVKNGFSTRSRYGCGCVHLRAWMVLCNA